jgi:hypothetical protein
MGRSLVVCGYSNYTGYGRHVTEIIRAFGQAGRDVTLIRPPLKDAPLGALDLPADSSVILHVRMPQAMRIVDGMLSVNWTIFEATRIPKFWVKPSLSHDLIILPTDSAKQAWIASGFQRSTSPCVRLAWTQAGFIRVLSPYSWEITEGAGSMNTEQNS